MGVYRVASGVVEDDAKVVFGSGDDILIMFRNTHATEVRRALVMLSGYEE